MIDDSFFIKKKEFITLKEALEITGSSLAKDQEFDLQKKIRGVATLDKALESDISFVNSGQYVKYLESSKAGFCFLQEKYLAKMPGGMIGLIHANPYFAYAKFIDYFYDSKKFPENNLISAKATIEKSATIGEGTVIMAGAYIGHHVKIGNNCVIGANVVIGDNCQIGNNNIINPLVAISFSRIGNNNIIHNGAKIGQDGFGFAHNQGVNHKILQLGIVIIGNDVEIGANSCVDRGAIENTIIGSGVKIDNMVQIAHNVTIGDGTVIAGCTAIAGSTKIGRFVQIGGACNINGHINIMDGAKIAGGSGVMRDVEPMQIVGGAPALPIKDWHRINAKLIRLIKSESE
jgi:UDP-3-O-[3-hydroxymyristoyl] glucosamine N-acyltransferase